MKERVKEQPTLARFAFRSILPQEAEEAADIEEICFPPHEACPRQFISARVESFPEMFLVAVERRSGRIAGLVTGIATDESSFRDEFFLDPSLHQPNGRYLMLLGLEVLPAYRHRGLAGELMARFSQIAKEAGKDSVILTCLEDKVSMYEAMGFEDRGLSKSRWGGEAWHEMVMCLKS